MTTELAALADNAAEEILADIIELVKVESHSYDLPGLAEGLTVLRDITVRRLGAPDHTETHPGGEHGDIVTHTFTGQGPGHVALIGHYDTVWPKGTLAGWPVTESVDDHGRRTLTGPGIFDMKTGVVQGIWALKLLRDSGAQMPTVTFLFNGDEEIGSLSSRPIIEKVAAEVDASLVLEASVDGAVKTGRKGTGIFVATATGIESHAGLAPEKGASAIHAMAEFITAAAAIADPAKGTTINVGLVSGGSGTNVVAGSATAKIDIRVLTVEEQNRVDAEFSAITVSDPRAHVEVRHDWNRPPMTLTEASAPLLDIARAVSAELGTQLGNVTVGGASDANFVAALGRPVLCGLGAVGGGAHARTEFIYPDTVPHQTALLAGILHKLSLRP
ncbi:M20 family metallopeptidase [Pseudonocardia spinosispora]|uniref:M20 family metallopeptidase n=1 Tax=Pseudonocardia spinosispora TaxID=103441 RepID=UPI00041B9597|nr:M20 family metallopeptidase [Pseudonocardia spinosispora]